MLPAAHLCGISKIYRKLAILEIDQAVHVLSAIFEREVQVHVRMTDVALRNLWVRRGWWRTVAVRAAQIRRRAIPRW